MVPSDLLNSKVFHPGPFYQESYHQASTFQDGKIFSPNQQHQQTQFAFESAQRGS